MWSILISCSANLWWLAPTAFGILQLEASTPSVAFSCLFFRPVLNLSRQAGRQLASSQIRIQHSRPRVLVCFVPGIGVPVFEDVVLKEGFNQSFKAALVVLGGL